MPGETLSRFNFWTIFTLLPDGSLQLNHELVVNGAYFSNGTIIRNGELMAGVDMNKRRGQDLAVVTAPDGAYILRGFYLPDGR